MEIKARGVPKLTVASIDLQAKQQGMSREAYIRNYLESEMVQPEVTQKEKEYINLLVRLLYLLDKNTKEWIQLYALVNPNWKEEINRKEDEYED